MTRIQTSILLLVLFWGMACQRPEDNSCASDFDQLALLTNIGEGIIVPSYSALATETMALEAASNSFLAAPTAANLVLLRNRLQSAWGTWQTAAIFEFGPAEDEALRDYCNNFPANIIRIGEGLTTGSYDLNTPAYSYARGFPTLDYLLYGENKTMAEIIELFTTDAQAANRQQYLRDVAALLRQKIQTVYEAWKVDGGNYLATFTTEEGVANGTPMSNLINQWNQNYELIKNNRLGAPISAKTGYVPLLPENVEAFYSGQSLSLVIKAVEAQKAVFLGLVNSENKLGLDDYLEAADAQKGGTSLALVIEEQYDATLAALNGLAPASLYDAITTNLDGVKVAYAAAQNQTVYTKTDLPAALCVSITYIDNVDDGD